MGNGIFDIFINHLYIQKMRLLDKYYYIVYFRDFIKPKIYPVYFVNRNAAIRAIKVSVGKKKRPFYDVLKGSKLKDFKFQFMFRLGHIGDFTKYEYPKDLKIARKSFRTKMRRRLRRMGMLTPIRNKYDVRQPPAYIKLIHNRQKVANCPNTIARCFRLERKPKHIYYRVLDKKLSKKKGILFEVQANRIDMKTGLIKKQKVQIKRNDIVIPYLLTEVEKMYYEMVKIPVGSPE
jgi:hypothetical protein